MKKWHDHKWPSFCYDPPEWYDFLRKIKAKGNKSIVNFYLEPERHYHNIDHILNCIEEFRDISSLKEHPNEVEMAIWYHDTIYNVRRTDNEEKSAQLAYETSINIGMSEEFAKRTHDLILQTKHSSIPKDIDAKILLDVDLSILGQSEEDFNDYNDNIKKEYRWAIKEFGENFYNKRRKEIMQGFLNRESIYFTDYFRDKYEKQAKNNIERLINELR